MAIAVTEIAKRAGVSKATVSRYLNGDPTLKIRPETQKKIMHARSKLGISISSTYRTPKRLAHNFVIPVNRIFQDGKAFTLFFLQMCKSIEEILEKNNFRLSINFFDKSNKYKTFSDLISSPQFCDGILLSTDTADVKLAELILESKIPHVSIEPRDEELGLNTVVPHSLLGIKQAVKYLAELGHTKFGFVGIKGNYQSILFTSVILENGFPFKEELCVYLRKKAPAAPESQLREIAHKEFSRKLKGGQLASAYICSSDLIAFGVIDAMREAGIEPGRDISVVGYDNIEEKEPHIYGSPILTTIDDPIDLIGKRCGEILLNQVFHKQTDIVHEHIPTKLIIRKTTGRYHGD